MASSTGKHKYSNESEPEDLEVEEITALSGSPTDKAKEDEHKKEHFARKFKVSKCIDTEILSMLFAPIQFALVLICQIIEI